MLRSCCSTLEATMANRFTWSKRHFLKRYLQSRSLHQKSSSQEIRKSFLDFFTVSHNHEFVASSSVIPVKDEGTYFTNAGMNQFKPIFLGTVPEGSVMSLYKRVTNSQKCVRVGGKHNDLEDVGKDLTHHTFFEMLGNWSFGDYFKTEACSMAMELLTQVYRIPLQNLYMTYFGGNPSLGLPSDEETREAWIKLGVPPDRVLPFGMKDNFWDMGDQGPCGPCTEIHYDHVGNRDASSLVNTGSPDVVEIWNLVFMQFDRQIDGGLVPLPCQHVDTGMGFERLCAILQGVGQSNYNTDLFQPLFKLIEKSSGCHSYQGLTGVEDVGHIDTAYRIVADHIRLATVAIGDGLLPGNGHIEHKLRQIIHRCLHQGHFILKISPGTLVSLVDVVVESLGTAYPELSRESKKIKEAISLTEEQYINSVKEGRQSFQKFLRKRNVNQTIEGEEVVRLYEGGYGSPLPIEIITILAQEHGLTCDLTKFEKKLQEDREISHKAAVMMKNSSRNLLDLPSLNHLQQMGVLTTDDSAKYNFTKIGETYEFPALESVSICCLLHDGKFVESVDEGQTCDVILERTNFYSKAGGQVASQGEITTHNATLQVLDVQKYQGYVLHTVTVKHGKVHVGESASCHLNSSTAEGCLRNHTATHLLNSALRKILGEIHQKGSLVTPDKLTFDFSYMGDMTRHQIEAIEASVREIIHGQCEVVREEMPLTAATSIPDLIKLDNEPYPEQVTVVSVVDGNGEQTSIELCGETHVHCTGDLHEFYITRLTGVGMGTKRVTAVTGDQARKAIENEGVVEDVYTQLETSVMSNINREKWTEWQKHIYLLLGEDLLRKTKRDEIQEKISRLGEKISSKLNKPGKEQSRREFLNDLLACSKPSGSIVTEINSNLTLKEMVRCIQTSAVGSNPICLVMRRERNLTCLIYTPQDFSTSSEWISEQIIQKFGGKRAPVKGKNSEAFHMVILNPTENIEHIVRFAEKCVC